MSDFSVISFTPWDCYFRFRKASLLIYALHGCSNELAYHLLKYLLHYMEKTAENSPRDWYVVYSNRHKEQQAQFHLSLKGVKSYFPRLSVPGKCHGNNKVVPLFPNYLFVRINLATEYHLVNWTPGIKRIVSFGDRPIPINDSVVRFLRCQADDNGIIRARSNLKYGEAVEISGGPFDGLIGVIQAPPDNRGRVKILLKLLNRQVSVNFGVEFIKSGRTVWMPNSPVQDLTD